MPRKLLGGIPRRDVLRAVPVERGHVDVDDVEGLATAVIQEIESDSKSVKGPVAAEYARNGFSWSTQVGKMIELYETAI